jgi:hypothetical protein
MPIKNAKQNVIMVLVIIAGVALIISGLLLQSTFDCMRGISPTFIESVSSAIGALLIASGVIFLSIVAIHVIRGD